MGYAVRAHSLACIVHDVSPTAPKFPISFCLVLFLYLGLEVQLSIVVKVYFAVKFTVTVNSLGFSSQSQLEPFSSPVQKPVISPRQ
jgi:hypothetical protein